MADKSESDRDTRQWYVRMETGGAVYGPVRTQGLLLWTTQGRVLPDDEVSEDQIHWRPAQEIPELAMDVLIAHPNGAFIGPFNRDALQVLIQEGKIPPDSVPFPKEELAQRMAARQLTLFGDEEVSEKPAPSGRRKTSRSARAKEDDAEGAGEDLRPQLAELHDLLESARRESAEAQARLEAAEDATRESETARKDAEKRLAESEAARKKAETSLAESDAARKAAEGRIAESDATRKDAEARLAESEAAHKEAEERLAATEAARKDAEARLAESEAAHKKAEERLAATEAARKDAEARQAESEAARKEAARLPALLSNPPESGHNR